MYVEITINLNAKAVRRTGDDGRAYLVAPLSMIVPGVLNGSKGPLLYPPDEIARNFRDWDGVSITRNHPFNTLGEPVSAKADGVFGRVGLGTVRNPSIGKGGRLVAEGWFDEEFTKNRAPDVHTALLAGTPVELSTGLRTDDDPSPGVWNDARGRSRSYTHVARNYRPDHLAVLTNETGACSLADGCGVLVNSGGGRRRNLFKEFVSAVVNALRTPVRSGNTGRYKPPGSGTGKGGVHSSAQSGAANITDEDREDGGRATEEWILDDDVLARAKASAADSGSADPTLIAHIYKKLGGRRKPVTNAECGCVLNSSVPGEPDMATKAEHVSYLTTNCDCWKGKADALNKLDDDTVKTIREDAEKKAAALNSAREPQVVDFGPLGKVEFVFNSASGKMECKPGTPKEECDKMMKGKDGKPEYAANAKLSPEQEAVLNSATEIVAEAKAELVGKIVDRLTNNSADAETRKRVAVPFLAFSPKQLKSYLADLPAADTRNATGSDDWVLDRVAGPKGPLPDYSGAAGGVTNRGNPAGDDPEDVLIFPAYNAEGEEEGERGKAAKKKA